MGDPARSAQTGASVLARLSKRVLRYLPLLTALLLLGLRSNQGWAEPSVLLFRATLDEARDFAVASASARGWSVPSVGQNEAVFEQILDDEVEDVDTAAGDHSGDEADDRLPAHRLIRIFAQFSEEAAGTRVLLSAHELETAQTGEWTTDVTDRYAEKLDNALSSLRSKWDAHRDPHASGSRDAAPITPGHGGAASIGIWAYYAERYAESRGCELTNRGALLESSSSHSEQHRVDCRDGRSLRVLCDQGDCTLR